MQVTQNSLYQGFLRDRVKLKEVRCNLELVRLLKTESLILIYETLHCLKFSDLFPLIK